MSWWVILLSALAAIAVVVTVVARALRGLDDGFDNLIDDEEECDDRNCC